MIKFTLRLFIFSIPFLVLIALEIYIDPFNYFSEAKNKVLHQKKEEIALKTNPYLYKLIEYDRNPCSTIILGDSRMDELSSAKFENIGEEKVSNLAIGGGTMQDAIKILDYISDKHEIKKIYWGVSLETYSGTRLRDRATPSIEIKKSFLLYLLNRYTFSSAMLICRSMITHEQIDLYKPPFSKEDFWQNQLDLVARYLANYSYPENYFRDLKKIAETCKEKDIKLVFVVCPTHVDLQKKIHEFNLDEQDKNFKIDMKSLGDVYDFNYPNVITNDKNNFNDPFHFDDSISKIIIQEISTQKIQYSKFTSFVK